MSEPRSGWVSFFHIFGALDEFQLDLIRENTTVGLAAARARGRVGGRPPKLSEKKMKRIGQMYDKKEMSVKEICEWAGIGKTTFYKYIRSDERKWIKKITCYVTRNRLYLYKSEEAMIVNFSCKETEKI